MESKVDLTRLERVVESLVPPTWVFMRLAALALVIGSLSTIILAIYYRTNLGWSMVGAFLFLVFALILFLESIPCRLNPERYED